MATKTTKPNMFGGIGTIEFLNILTEEQLNGKCRVYAKVTVPPHCSIGYHVHNGDSESYYVLSGKGILDDNHENTVEMLPGNDYYTPDGKGHGVVNDHDEPLEMMALIIYTK